MVHESGAGGAGRLAHSASRGGWTDSSALRGRVGTPGGVGRSTQWVGPGGFDSNRNVKAPDRIAQEAAQRQRINEIIRRDPVYARNKLGIF